MNSIFDYIYYRVCRMFFKWDGTGGNRGLFAVAMIQAVFIADILLLIVSISWGRKIMFPYSKAIGFACVSLVVILVILNSRKYGNRYNEFDVKWGAEPGFKQILKGFLVVFSILMPWIGLFLVSQLK
ncbi:MAG: Uncharacterized protein JWO06_42 [Bacteroidota bacterium]|nr:Uncharacterized protein [Bacteroidota bacterium]